MRLRFVYEMISYLLRKSSASMKKVRHRNTRENFWQAMKARAVLYLEKDMNFFDGIFCGLYKQGGSLRCAGSICIHCGT